MTEKEKMLAGQPYSAVDQQLLEELMTVKDIIHKYNALAPSDSASKLAILKDLLGHIGDDKIIINQPFSACILFDDAPDQVHNNNVHFYFSSL